MRHVDFLIAGGGHAGLSAAATIRESGAEGDVLIVSAEQERPYSRYMLSKEFLRGERERDQLSLRPESFYEDNRVQIMTGARAASLDTINRTVTLDSGEDLRFGKLLLATGASVRRLRVPGAGLPGVYYLRSLADSEALRGQAERGKRAVIIGGGFIGVEVAASLTQLGVEATIVASGETLWANYFGEEMGRVIHDHLESGGVTVVKSTRPDRIEGDGRAERVLTQDGRVIPCDLVLVGIGVEPETALAESAGLEVDNGVLTNEYLETSESGIFAAGDIASYLSPFSDTHVRIEHWEVAGAQGATAASNMLGEAKPFDEVPYFFSSIFDVWLDYLGHAPTFDKLSVRRYDNKKLSAFYSQGGKITAALMLNRSEDMDACTEIIKSQMAIEDYAMLEDPGVDLTSVVGRAEAGTLDGRVEAGSKDELGAGEMKTVDLGERSALLVNVDGELFAVDNECAHRACPLSRGSFEGDVVECGCHGSQYNVKTGELVRGPAREGVRSYPVQVEEIRYT